MADMFFNSFKKRIADGTIDLDSHTFKVVLLTSAYTPDATDAVFADLNGEVTDGNGYTSGGGTLTGVTWALAGGTATFDANDLSWTSATFTARYGVIYDFTATNKDLVMLIDFGGDKSPSNGTLTLLFNASGIFSLT